MVFLRDDEYFMGQALKEAEAAYEIDEVPVGAVVVINNKIISRGHNQVEYIDEEFGKEKAEEYVDNLLDHHEVEKKKDRKELEEVFLDKIK